MTADVNNPANAPIAIVGMGLVFPSDQTPQNAEEAKRDFWQTITEGRTMAGPPPAVPNQRWQLTPDACYAPYSREGGTKKPKPDKVHGPHACFVHDHELDINELISSGLRLDAGLLEQLDPVYKLPLFAMARCLVDSRMQPAQLNGTAGLVMGNIALPTNGISDFAQGVLNGHPQTHPLNQYVTGLPASLTAQAASLTGPCHTLDAACASSLYAIKFACDYLKTGQADIMFAGGLSRPDSLYTQMGFSQLTAISASGQCSPFDEQADGLLVGEGCGLFALKRLTDAQRDGDHIYATIAGIGLSSDIEGSLFAPASEGQVRAMRQAYDFAGWQPDSIQLIECHGTGTPKGDQEEVNSLKTIWENTDQANQCVIGSVKSNVGHLLTGAGAAGLAKVLLAFEHDTLPPTAHFESAGQHLGLESSPFKVLAQPKTWDKANKRAAVSAFGFGGINAHLLLSHQPEEITTFNPAPDQSERLVIVAIDRREHRETSPVDIPAGQFPIPPLELKDASNQQKIMLASSGEIMKQRTQYGPSNDSNLRMGVFIGIAQDLGVTRFNQRWHDLSHGRDACSTEPLTANRVMGNLGAITASRIARSFKVGGPAFTVSSEETSGHKALETAAQLLRTGEIDEAIIGACHTFNPFNQHELKEDQSAAVAISMLVMRERDALARSLPILGVIDAIDSSLTQHTTWQVNPQVDQQYGAATSLYRLAEKLNGAAISQTSQELGGGHCQIGPMPQIQSQQDRQDMPEKTSPVQGTLLPSTDFVQQQVSSDIAQSLAQQSFLAFSQYQQDCMASLLGQSLNTSATSAIHTQAAATATEAPPASVLGELDYQACMEYAIGSIATSLDPVFAPIDQYPTRVRLPDEPLMLAHRILKTEGPVAALADPSVDPTTVSGRTVTEHDIHPGSWYLDHGRIPTCIAVEAGQADLYLSGFLGIDFRTKGLAVYRLLDAVVTFHAPLPSEGQTINYDIRIRHFFTQGDTHLFRFEFDATVNGQLVLTMRDGIAGFFTQQELDAGQGIVLTKLETQPAEGITAGDFKWLTPKPEDGVKYSDIDMDVLRLGQIDKAFGAPFDQLNLVSPVKMPGVPGSWQDNPQLHQTPTMSLVHRILTMSPDGGRFGLGQITGEADIHKDDWFLTCHFVDDQVMPGTLMYECCLHTLRVMLLRMGWVCENDEVVYEPVPGSPGQLKCRGQVTEHTKTVQYEITVKEIGYKDFDDVPGTSTPYVIADALMYADHRPVVQMKNMSLRLSGLTKARLEEIWQSVPKDQSADAQSVEVVMAPADPAFAQEVNPKLYLTGPRFDRRPALYDFGRIHAYSNTNPSDGFGEPYRIFDPEGPLNPNGRVLARLPRAPYMLVDRVVAIQNAAPFQFKEGAKITAQYDVAPVGSTPQIATAAGEFEEGWFYSANRQKDMPFAFLLEIALQPCGWLAAYLGSALSVEEGLDIRFRNLGGSATLLAPLTEDIGTLTTEVTLTRISQSAGMIIQNFDMHVTARNEHGQTYDVYKGDTYFGFFSKEALANQIGLRDVTRHTAEKETAPDISSQRENWLPDHAPLPDNQMRMIDRVSFFAPEGGPEKLGLIVGKAKVNPENWFFKAHFFQDPVWPGSLGLESFQQLLKVVALHLWSPETLDQPKSELQFEPITRDQRHQWTYRGQILPTDEEVTVEAWITAIDHERKAITASGFLIVDGRIIYQMNDFGLKISD